MEGKTNFPRRLKQFDGLTWLTLTLTPLFFDKSTPLVNAGSSTVRFAVWVDLCRKCHLRAQKPTRRKLD